MIDIVSGTLNCIDAAGDITRTPPRYGIEMGIYGRHRRSSASVALLQEQWQSQRSRRREANLG
jgi:hypothetical protein